VRKREMPMRTWLGGTCWRERALFMKSRTIDIRRKLVTRMRMLGARESAVSRRRSWTEKATSFPVLGLRTRRSTRGTRGTLVGRPEVARTEEPAELDLAPALPDEGGGGVNVWIADEAEVGAFVGAAGAVCVWAPAAPDSASARAKAVKRAFEPLDLDAVIRISAASRAGRRENPRPLAPAFRWPCGLRASP